MSRCGLDEVGRGALAGPVVVGAVCLGPHGTTQLVADLLQACQLKQLKDSKKLSRAQRLRVFTWLESKINWSVGSATALEIDEQGLTKALTLAAGRAIQNLAKPENIREIVADAGLFHPFEDKIPTQRFIKGDEQILEITLASIMAKVWRDGWMQKQAPLFPQYGFEQHVGYGTARHYAALNQAGLTVLHRRRFFTSFNKARK